MKSQRPVFCTFLDATNAFDRINYCKLFSLLIKRGLPACVIVRPSGKGTVHSRPHKIFLHFHQLWTLLNKIREGVALSPLRIFL